MRVGDKVTFKYEDKLVTRKVIQTGDGFVAVEFNSKIVKLPEHKIRTHYACNA